MGRRSENVAVPNFGGRDDGKLFNITEMASADAEMWAYRLFIAMKGTSGEIPENIASLGMVGVAIRGLNVFLAADVRFELLEPLLNQMFTCVKIVRDHGQPTVVTPLLPDDIEEVQTRAWLRSEVLRVHTGFSFAGALWTLVQATRALADSPNTSTSLPASE